MGLCDILWRWWLYNRIYLAVYGALKRLCILPRDSREPKGASVRLEADNEIKDKLEVGLNNPNLAHLLRHGLEHF